MAWPQWLRPLDLDHLDHIDMHPGDAPMPSDILASDNPAFGFLGTMHAAATEEDAADAWRLATRQIRDATGCTAEQARDFLDSRQGRHFADDVSNELQDGAPIATAVAAACEKWMQWRVSNRDAAEQGLRRHQSLLVAYTHARKV